MPIVVACPNCPTKLSAPDTAAGKQIRCPKCGTVAPVPDLIPAEEVPVVEATVAPPKPKPKPVQAEVDEDDPPRKKATRRDDDDDEPPRKKKKRHYDDDDRQRRRRKSGASGGMIALIVVGGLLLLAGIGTGIYFLSGKGGAKEGAKGEVFAKKAPVPPGWTQYSNPRAGFKAYFPSPPGEETMPVAGGGIGGRPGRGGVNMGGLQGGNELQGAESWSEYHSGDWKGPIYVAVTVVRYRNSVPASIRDQMREFKTAKFDDFDMRVVRWLGYDAAETAYTGGVVRIVCTDQMLILASITGPNGPFGSRATPEEEAAFFDNFELTK